ncbi:EF-P lysine aminoacylase GenX [Oryzomonas sagensis]|uniref:EF-P lysine aminoacylase GenX n=1 Tax=Oryzomonas sagensis TaxID=2603857 RepID=A0ABQ6TMJ6_9BACT|nr:EF-P lysine aminoacylase EpmA [Oryzomonas sagensis]KAB0669687.1 EF-P lysine aminoacylase GenX [Oryzomonas sagensis]
MSSSRLANLHLRARVIQTIREFFRSRGFLEVETPHRIPANAPEEHIEPYRSDACHLQTSPEICMKRLLCRGYGNIFQICRCWRSDERGRRHVPEFTMLEWYRADSDYFVLMRDCEELLKSVVETTSGGTALSYQGRKIEVHNGSRRITVREAFERFGGTTVEAALHDGTFDEIMVTAIEPALPQDVPAILMDYPAAAASLARLKPGDPTVGERFELYAGGLELANGFSELNDPREQRARFLEANDKRLRSGLPPLPLPEPFLADLGDMPPAAGIALGIDRLVMLCADADRIDDVVAFTPEEL